MHKGQSQNHGIGPLGYKVSTTCNSHLMYAKSIISNVGRVSSKEHETESSPNGNQSLPGAWVWLDFHHINHQYGSARVPLN